MSYGVILADPPWRYANWSDAAHGAAISAYECMSDKEIQCIPVSQWAHDDCWLALWTTFPKLQVGMSVMDAWCFEYVTAIPWVKTVPSSGEIYRGIGFHSMAAAEILLLGRRGKAKMANRENTPLGLIHDDPRVFYTPRGKRHSQKPEEVQDWLERRYKGPFLELFARRQRPNWTCWGHELGDHISSNGVIHIEK